MGTDYLSTGDAARVLGVPLWRVRRSTDRLQPPVPRFCGKRAIPASRLPELQDVVKKLRPGPRSKPATTETEGSPS